MTIYYIDPDLGNDTWDGLAGYWISGTNGPKKTQPAPLTNDTHLFKRGTTTRGQINYGSQKSNFTVDAYGVGELPIINGADIITTWSTTAYLNVFSYVTADRVNTCGNVVENGNPLNYVTWSTNLSTTYLSMAPGSFTFDYANSTLYVYITSVSLAASTLEVAMRSVQASSSFDSTSNITVKNIHFRQGNLHGVSVAGSVTGFYIGSCKFSVMGGGWISSTVQAGNGVQFATNSSGASPLKVVVENNIFDDVFDSATTVQSYINVAASMLGPYDIRNNTISRCGMAALEIAPSAGVSYNNQIISGVRFYKNTVKDCGYGWSGGRAWGGSSTTSNGAGVIVWGTASATNLAIVQVYSNTITNCGFGVRVADQLGLVTIWGNIIDGSKASAISVVNNTWKTTSYKNVYAYSNIIINCKATPNAILTNNEYFDYGIAIQRTGYSDASCVFANNLIKDCSEGFHYVLGFDPAPGVVRAKLYNNLFLNVSNVFPSSSQSEVYWFDRTNNVLNSTSTKPLNSSDLTISSLLDFTTANTYKLPTTSPCKFAGTFSGYFTDFRGMPFNNPPSIGPFEFSS
ncbi:MAG: right-handed parallel beta-helix repeat-containing protein, partial [Ignisphaera sp.]|nr:right-handed parallel beta-helix repeat-containing protein [Ignisphaera sp.]